MKPPHRVVMVVHELTAVLDLADARAKIDRAKELHGELCCGTSGMAGQPRRRSAVTPGASIRLLHRVRQGQRCTAD